MIDIIKNRESEIIDLKQNWNKTMIKYDYYQQFI